MYGLNGKVPFSEKDSIAHPVSLYAASKKSNFQIAQDDFTTKYFLVLFRRISLFIFVISKNQ